MAAKQAIKENLQCTSKYGHLRISQEILSCRMTDIEGFLTIYGHSDNLLNNNYIYFLGGWPENTWRTWRIVDPWRMADAERYDLRTNTWDKIADLQEPRAGASGAAANGKIFVYGDYFAEMEQRLQLQGRICEMYYEASNEWHFITRNILGCTMGMGVQMTKCFK